MAFLQAVFSDGSRYFERLLSNAEVHGEDAELHRVFKKLNTKRMKEEQKAQKNLKILLIRICKFRFNENGVN